MRLRLCSDFWSNDSSPRWFGPASTINDPADVNAKGAWGDHGTRVSRASPRRRPPGPLRSDVARKERGQMDVWEHGREASRSTASPLRSVDAQDASPCASDEGIGFPKPTLYFWDSIPYSLPSHTPWVPAPVRPARTKRERQCTDCGLWNWDCGLTPRILRIRELHSPHSGVWGCTRNCELDGDFARRRTDPLFRLSRPSRRRPGLGRSRAERTSRFRRFIEPADAVRRARRPACVRDGDPDRRRGSSHCQQPPGSEACGVLASGRSRGTGVPPGALVPPWPDCRAAARAS